MVHDSIDFDWVKNEEELEYFDYKMHLTMLREINISGCEHDHIGLEL